MPKHGLADNNNSNLSQQSSNPTPLMPELWSSLIVPYLANKADRHRYRMTCKFFTRTSTQYEVNKLRTKLITNHPEVNLSSLESIIPHLKNPNKVYHQFLWLTKTHNILTRALLHDLCYELNNPLLWLLIDDNATEFFLKLSTTQYNAIDFLTAAIALNSVFIVDYLLLNHRQDITPELSTMAYRAALFSRNPQMIMRLNQQSLHAQYKDIDLIVAVSSRNLAMVELVLTQANSQDLDVENPNGMWDESIWNEAALSGELEIMNRLFAYAEEHGGSYNLLPIVLLEGISSGTVDMVDAIRSRSRPPYHEFYQYLKPPDICRAIAASGNLAMYDKVKKDLLSIRTVVIDPVDILIYSALYNNVPLFNKILEEYPALDLSKEQLKALLQSAASSGRIRMLNRVMSLSEKNKVSLTFDLDLLNAAARSNATMFSYIISQAKEAQLTMVPTLATLEHAIESGQPQLVQSVLLHARTLGHPLELNERLFTVAVFCGGITLFNLLVSEADSQKVSIEYSKLLINSEKYNGNPLLTQYLQNRVDQIIDSVDKSCSFS